MKCFGVLFATVLESAYITVILASAATLPVRGQDISKTTSHSEGTPVKLRVKVYPMRSLRPQETGTPAVIEFDGVSYHPPIKIEPVSEKLWDVSSPETAIRGYWGAIRVSNMDWILRTFAPESRDSVRFDLSNKEIYDKNIEGFKSMLESHITETYVYGDYRILATTSKLKDGKWLSLFAVYKKTRDGWLRTNDLKADTFAHQLFGHIMAETRKVN